MASRDEEQPAVFAVALIVEAIHLRDLPALVVSPALRISGPTKKAEKMQTGTHLMSVMFWG